MSIGLSCSLSSLNGKDPETTCLFRNKKQNNDNHNDDNNNKILLY